jgi:hypothetical protein
MTEAGTIVVPGRGSCELTAWSKRQLASRLGVQWDRWFDLIDPQVRAEEVNRRFRGAPGEVRLKTTIGDEPTLRGFVSVGYSTVDDSFVAHSLLGTLGPDARIIRRDATDRTTGYVVQVGEPLRFGGPVQVGDVVGGVLVRNSDVGYASLVVSVHLTRLVCTNGLVVPEKRDIIRAPHRGIRFAALNEKLHAGTAGLPSRVERAGRLLERSGHHGVTDVEGALVDVLRMAHLPRRLLPVMMSAYTREPSATAFGISQAITLGAQARGITPEDRVALEVAAGEYLAGFGGG